jgi:O-antigen ligase
MIVIPLKAAEFKVGGTTILRPDWFVAGIYIVTSVILYTLEKRKIYLNWSCIFAICFAITPVFTIHKTVQHAGLLDWITVSTQILFAVAFLIIIYNTNVSTSDIQLIFRVMYLVAFVVSCYGLYQYFARQIGLPFAYINGMNQGPEGFTRVSGYHRISSFFREPSFLAAYLSPVFLMAVVDYMQRGRKIIIIGNSFMDITIISVMALCILGTSSLSAYVTVTIVLGLYLLVSTTRFILKSLVLALSTSILLAITSILGYDVISLEARITRIANVASLEFYGLRNTSIGRRLAVHKLAFGAWSTAPILGVGVNNLPSIGTDFLPQWAMQRPTASAHNGFLQVLSELGLLGFVFFVATWLSVLYKVLTLNYCVNAEVGDVRYPLVVLISSTMVILFSGYPYMDTLVWLYLSLGLLAATVLARRHRVEA